MTVGDPSYWDEFFEENLLPAALAHLVATWEQMPKPGPSDLEDVISVKLYSALLRAKDRSAHAFLIRYQDVEVDTDLTKATGRKDIVFFPSLQDEEIYLCLEAKRLNAVISGMRRSLADEYVKKGMQRFVDGKYSRSVRHGAMLGYVLDGDTDRAMRSVDKNIRSRLTELRMDKNGGLLGSAIRVDDPHSKQTDHHRAHETTVFRIHHLFVTAEEKGPVRALSDVPAALKSRLEVHGQTHVLRWWSELSAAERQRLARQIESLDLERIAALWSSRQQAAKTAQTEDVAQLARRAVPPASIVRLPQTTQERDEWNRAHRIGEELLRAGQVGALLVAGGQGTRLGFDKPKGMFPIGPVSHASLFEILAEQVLARSRRAGKPIPYFIMTSDATHEETVDFFSEHRFFGLPPGDVFFFEQGNMPAVDAATGKLLLADKGMLSTSPDGHGGMLAALAKAGLLDEMRRRGIELLHYHQVDNPTAIVCDPVFLGFHAQREAEMSIKVVAKRSAGERMGVAVDVDGRTQIIEYSDLPAEVAGQTDERGELLLWAGSTAIHVFSRSFLDRVAKSDSALPFHIAHKKVPYCDEHGSHVAPERENAYKFERFIFDALPAARRSLVLETDRGREFNPVKNATGDDSPETAREALVRLHRGWLRSAGALVDDRTAVEISPLFALDADEVRAKIQPGTRVTEATFFCPPKA